MRSIDETDRTETSREKRDMLSPGSDRCHSLGGIHRPDETRSSPGFVNQQHAVNANAQLMISMGTARSRRTGGLPLPSPYRLTIGYQ